MTSSFEKLHHIGQFTISSGKARITDPCYDKKTWCAGTVKVENGVWNAYTLRKDFDGDGDIRVWELLAAHENMTLPIEILGGWEEIKDLHVGVDSGQAGIFDEKLYPKKGSEDKKFYRRICDLTGPKEAYYSFSDKLTRGRETWNKFRSIVMHNSPEDSLEIILKDDSMLEVKSTSRKEFFDMLRIDLGATDGAGDAASWLVANYTFSERDIPEIAKYKESLSHPWGGVIEFGAASSSGYGDGGYPAYGIINENKNYVALKIEYIAEEDFSDEDEEAEELPGVL